MTVRQVQTILGSEGRNLSPSQHPYILGMWEWKDDDGDYIEVSVGFDPNRRAEYRCVRIQRPDSTISMREDED
jgi:hypothetical protein